MNPTRRRVLMLAPGCDGEDVGESWSCFKWVEGVAEHHDVTLLTLQRAKQKPMEEQIPNIRVFSWPDLNLPERLERFQSMAKPGYFRFYRAARKWMEKKQRQGTQFDVVHQVGPLALRYASPAAEMPWPYIFGPLAGSLTTPEGFRRECTRSNSWFTRLRALDQYRLRFDRQLRRSYERAAIVLAVAPYVGSLLSGIKIKRIEYMSETGISDRPLEDSRSRGNTVSTGQTGKGSAGNKGSAGKTASTGKGLRLLYVGRLVRTKGLRDLIRAMEVLRNVPGLSLDVAGAGEDGELCLAEVTKFKLNDRVHFHGKVSREEVETLYQSADAFVFPSFREPSGNVVFEAMRHGLPVITTNRGGPGFVVNGESGIRLDAYKPSQLAEDLANAIRKLASNPAYLQRLSTGACLRVQEVALWPKKIQRIVSLYEQVCNHKHLKGEELSYV